MTEKTKQLTAELEKLRQDRDFMYKTLLRRSISPFLGLGTFSGGTWKKYFGTVGLSSAKTRCESKTPEEAYQYIDMRCLLYTLFWTLQGRSPLKKDPLEVIGNDAFWLEFLHLAKASNWQPKQLQQAILASNSPFFPQPVRVAGLALSVWQMLGPLSKCGLAAGGLRAPRNARVFARAEISLGAPSWFRGRVALQKTVISHQFGDRYVICSTIRLV